MVASRESHHARLENWPPILRQILTFLLHRDQIAVLAGQLPLFPGHIETRERYFPVRKFNVYD